MTKLEESQDIEQKELVIANDQVSQATSTNEETLAKTWSKVIDQLSKVLKKPSISTWIKPAKLTNLSNDFITIAVKNEFSRNFLYQSYKEIIQNAFKEVLAKSLALQIIIDENLEIEASTNTEIIKTNETSLQTSIASLASQTNRKSINSKLNSSFNFDNFILDKFNNSAYSFSQAITNNSSGYYKSLFIYADSGLGKTHLLNAIGNEAKKNDADIRVQYVNAETFTNSLIVSIQKNQTGEFRKKYRNLDLLVFDDFNFLDNKKTCQEEFCYTYESIINNGGSVIISSNKELNNFKNLSKKLLSRLNGSLKTDIKAPGFAARIKILEHLCAKQDLQLKEEELVSLARKFDGNIRELEGALAQISAYKNYSVAEHDDQVIANLFGAFDNSVNYRGLSLELIIKTCAHYFDISEKDIIGKRRLTEFTQARHIAIYLSHSLLELSYNRIGEAFSNRRHSSIIHSIKTVEKHLAARLPSDRYIQKAVDNIKSKLI